MSGFVRFFNLLGFVGILHDTGKMLGFVKFYAAGGAEVCVCLSWNWLNLSIKFLFGGMGRAYGLGNAHLSPSAHAWTFPTPD